MHIMIYLLFIFNGITMVKYTISELYSLVNEVLLPTYNLISSKRTQTIESLIIERRNRNIAAILRPKNVKNIKG